MKNSLFEICSTEFIHGVHGGKTAVIFRNNLTNAQAIKVYKTERAAKAQATQFHNRMARIYSQLEIEKL